MSDIVERLSEEVHNSWWAEKKRQGFHSPNDCMSKNHISYLEASWKQKERFEDNINPKLYKWCNLCHPDMYPYNNLAEHIKEYDRVTVRTVLLALNKQGYDFKL